VDAPRDYAIAGAVLRGITKYRLAAGRLVSRAR
jgi:hypothetical protein